MSLGVQYQPNHLSTYTASPVVENRRYQYSYLNHGPIPMQSRRPEAAPPYSEVAFQERCQQSYDQSPYPSGFPREARINQLNTYNQCQFEQPSPGNSYDAFPDANPFRRETQNPLPHQDESLPKELNNLKVQDSGYHAGPSAYTPANPSRRSEVSQNHDSVYTLQETPQFHRTAPSISSIASNDPDCEPSEKQILERALAFYHNASIPPSSIPGLDHPIVIPQAIPGGGQPFTRAWAPALSARGVTPNEFLAFIDGLNIVSTANPPLQVLNLAGGLIGMVPYHWAAIAGLAIQATARLGTVAVSKGRTEMFMKEANEKFFAPRKLKAAIASRDAVGSILRLPNYQPILAPLTRETMHMSMVERSLVVMKGYAAELDFNVPPPMEQTTVLAKMSAKQIERQGKKNDEKILQERAKAFEKEEKERIKDLKKQAKERAKRRSGSDGGSQDESDPKSKKVLKREMSREQKRRREEEKAERESARKHGKGRKDKEAEKARKLLWILIENA